MSDTESHNELEQIGQAFKDAREALGLTVMQVAIDLRLLEEYVEGLESGDHSAIKSTVFVKGYIRTYSNYLKLDAEVLLAKYNQNQPKKVEEEEQVPESSNRTAIIVASVIAIILGAWVLLSIDYGSSSDSTEVQSPTVVEPQVTEPEVVVENNSPTAETLEDNIVVTDEVVDESIAEAVVEELPAIDIAQAQTPAPQVEQPVSEGLMMRFTGECWVEVRDKAGRLLLADLKQSGDEVSLAGEPPYKVVVGNASVVEVFFEGKAVSVAGRGESNTAKLVIGE